MTGKVKKKPKKQIVVRVFIHIHKNVSYNMSTTNSLVLISPVVSKEKSFEKLLMATDAKLMAIAHIALWVI